MAKREKPVEGHKCSGAQHGVRVSCECGWSSSVWYGPGSRKSAYSEWRYHVEQHAKKSEEPGR